MHRSGLCALLLIGLLLPRGAAAKGLLIDESDRVLIGNPQPGALQGYCIPLSALALLHVGFGAALPFYPRQPTPGDMQPTPAGPTGDTRTMYVVDAGIGMQCGWNRDGKVESASLLLTPQAGYTLQ